MFFKKELLAFNILDVIELKQQNVNCLNSGRNYDALSFRFRADAYLKDSYNELHVGNNSVTFIPSRVEFTRVASIDELIIVHFDTSGYSSKQLENFTSKNPKKLSALFCEIFETWQNKDVGYKSKCTALLYEIFTECYIENFEENLINPKIEEAVVYINKNFKDPNLSIPEIAQKAFMSNEYFRKLFKEEFGVSPQRYIIKLRLQNAIELISSGYYTLSEVTSMSGYNDVKYFSVEFKKYMGVSPSKYKYNYIHRSN